MVPVDSPRRQYATGSRAESVSENVSACSFVVVCSSPVSNVHALASNTKIVVALAVLPYVQHIETPSPTRDASSVQLARLVLIGGVAIWIANAVWRWWLGAPLGHDEARYALDARDLLSGTPTRFLYSAGGMTLVPVPGLVLGGSERALRLLPLVLGCAFLASAWWVAKRVSGGTVAAWTVGVLAGARQFARQSSELLSDLPSTACLLAALAIALGEVGRERLTYRIVAIAPLFALAFYLRYGSCISIAVVSATLLVFNHRAVLRNPRPVVWAALLLVALLVPHAIRSVIATGSPAGILRLSAAIPAPPEGALAYLNDPIASCGVLVAPLMVIGIVGARQRAQLCLLLASLGQIAVLSYTSYPQPRFVFFATTLLVILGVDAAARFAARTPTPLHSWLRAGAGLVVCASWVTSLWNAAHYAEVRRSGPTRTLLAAAIIARDRGADSRCEVVGMDLTRLEWYSGCRAIHVGDPVGQGRRYQIGNATESAVPAGAIRIAFLPGIVDVVRLR